METITLFLCAAGLVALFLAIFGNTRPLGGLVAAFVVGGLCFAWVLSLRSIHMGATIFILAIVFGLPLSAFLGYMACAALAGWSTTRLGRGPRAFFALIALACLGGALAPYVLEEMEERQRENTAAQTARESFPPAYRDLCAPVAAPEAFDKEAWPRWITVRDDQAISFYKELAALLRDEPLVPGDTRNRAVLTVLRLTTDEIKRYSERRGLLADAERFWNTPDPSGQYRLAAAVIIGCSLFREPLGEKDELAERVLRLKESSVKARLWDATGRKVDDEMVHLVSWCQDEAERVRLFNDVLLPEPEAHSWELAERIVLAYRDQDMRETVIRALADAGGPVEPQRRGLYYGLYTETGNKRWLELAAPERLFAATPEAAGHELFFLSELSLLRGRAAEGVRQRAEYLLAHLEDQYLAPWDERRPRLYDQDGDGYVPCSSSALSRECSWGDKRISYKIGDDFHYDRSGTISTPMGLLLQDFEEAALRCFSNDKKGQTTPKERQCVFEVIEKMDITEIQPGIIP